MNKVICPHCKKELHCIVSSYSIHAGKVLKTFWLEDPREALDSEDEESEDQDMDDRNIDYYVTEQSFDGFFCLYCEKELSESYLEKMQISLPPSIE